MGSHHFKEGNLNRPRLGKLTEAAPKITRERELAQVGEKLTGKEPPQVGEKLIEEPERELRQVGELELRQVGERKLIGYQELRQYGER